MKRATSKNYLSNNHSSVLKENNIQNLKQQVNELKDLEYGLFRLNDQIVNIQLKYKATLDEKSRGEHLLKDKLSINKQSAAFLQSDVQLIQAQVSLLHQDLDTWTRDNATLQRKCDNKQNQIINLSISLKELQKNNQSNFYQLKAAEQALQKVKQHKLKVQQECDKFCKKLGENSGILKLMQKQTKNQLIIQKSLNSTLQVLKQEGKQFYTQMKAKENILQQTTQKNQSLSNDVKQLLVQNQKLEKQSKVLQQSCVETAKTLQVLERGNEQKKFKLRELEANTLKSDQDLRISFNKKDKLMKEHSALANKNKDLNLQIDDCLMKIIQAQNINKVLKKQVQFYINCDEQARLMLDRRQKMTELLQSVGNKLNNTESAIAHLM